MRETPTHGPTVDVVTDEDADARGAAPFVVGGLVLLLPLVLFSWLSLAVDAVAHLGGTRLQLGGNAGVDVFGAVVLTSLFVLALRALAGATSTAAR